MTKIGEQLTDLMVNQGKTAPEITHALKILGNGNMQHGFSRIGEFFSEEINNASLKGLFKGRIQGGIAGALGTITLGGLISLIINKRKQSASHETEGQEILKALKTIPTTTKYRENNDTNPNTDVTNHTSISSAE